MLSLISWNDISFELEERKGFHFTITNKELSKVFDCNESTIRRHKADHKEELVNGKHFIIEKDFNNRKVTKWTKNGVVRLGFFINTKRAKLFRDWAEDYIVETQDLNAMRRGYQSALAKKDKVIAELRAELKLLPAPKSGYEPFEFNALLNVMSQGEKAIKTIEEEMGNMKMMFDRLYKGQPKYNVMGVVR